ncbi:MAG: hypothetical protein KatS3mg050_3260 [Litorilinea sp.]|nr:MAG: hypothetical protein KatS3mg050_3260 [Litorilinea sp.]
MVAWIALIATLLVAGYVWKLHQELETARQRLDRYNRALFDASDEIRQLREALHETGARLHAELLQRTHTVAFHPEMTVREAQLLHPQVQEVMAAFHLGGCSSCAVEPDETLAAICRRQGLDVNQLVGALNQLVDQSANGHDAPAPKHVKIPNVELNF